MPEKRLTAYELGQEWSALESLIYGLTDPETGETRELTDAEKNYLEEQIEKIGGDIKAKINGICKVFKNLKMEAEIAEAEKSTLKGELDRLSKRAKARCNEADRVKFLASMLLDKIKERKMKTELFTVYYQPTQESVKEDIGFFNPDKIPVEFLHREINKTAVKKAIDDGRIYRKDEKEFPLLKGKLYYKNDSGQEMELVGVSCTGGETLIIR